MSRKGKQRLKRITAVVAIFALVMTAALVYIPHINSYAAVQYEDIEKFPESYKAALYALKEKHSNWTFEVMDTGLDWNTVVSNEMNPDYRSLVPTYFDSKFVGRNYGDGWACATQEAVEYYLDPRNWFTEDYIFQFEKLTYNSDTQGIATVQKVLQNTFMSGYIQSDAQNDYQAMGLTYAQAFFDIGKRIGVSPVHLATRVKQEQGTQGTSDLISGVYPGYEGYYNYYNIQASGSTHEQIVVNGLNEAKSEGWNTRYGALYGGSQKVANRYILRGQDTLYLQKFDVDGQYDGRYWHQYMQNLAAPSNESRNTKRAYESAGMLDEAFVFKIPVYNNMPGTVYKKTIDNGTYIIASALNNSIVLDIAGNSADNGANVGLWNSNGLSCQRYVVKYVNDGFYTIQPENSGLYLDVAGAGQTEGTNVQQWSDTKATAQQWAIQEAEDGNYYIISRCNGLYLDIKGDKAVAGANIQVARKTGGYEQMFKLIPVGQGISDVDVEEGAYKIVSALNDEYVWDIAGNSADNGANLEVWHDNGLLCQRYLIYKDNGNYEIVAMNSGRSVDVAGAEQAPGTNIQQWDRNGCNAQRWIISDAGNGYVYISSKCNGLFATVDKSSAGANISMQYFSGSDSQKFKLVKNNTEALNEVSVNEGVYIVTSAVNESIVFDIAGNSGDSGANLATWTSNGLSCQRFNVVRHNDGYTMTAMNSGKNLDVAAASSMPGTNVQQWDANGCNAQDWKFYDAGDGYVYIKSLCNNLYLTMDGESAGANINMQYYTGSANQKFKLAVYVEVDTKKNVSEGIYNIASCADESLLLDIAGNSADNGANLELWTANGVECQNYEIKYIGDGYYTIVPQNSGLYLDVAGASNSEGTNVQQWTWTDSDAQRWMFVDAGDGTYYIVSKCNGLYLTAEGEGVVPGSNMAVYADKQSDNQKFRLNKIN